MRSAALALLLCGVFACASEEPQASGADASILVGESEDTGAQALDAGFWLGDQGVLDTGLGIDAGFADTGTIDIPGGGFIGSPCDDVSDCDYENAICVTDNIMHGLCTLPCDRFCPDRDAFPVTYCVDPLEIDSAFTAISEQGACVSRCNFETFPENGCREGFGCVRKSRYNESSSLTTAIRN